MPFKLAIASLGTIGVLAGSVVMVLSAGIIIGGAHPIFIVLLMMMTVFFSFLGWAIGPWFTDLIQGWVYNLEKLEFAEFEQRHPDVGAFMRKVCEDNRMPVPKIRLIHDDNPTAYTYGSLPMNARVALSDGLFRFLDTEEVCAVAAHELGHIRHYDFAVMTLASTLLQLLYEMYWLFTRKMSRGRNNPLPLIGLGAYILWFLGTYLVLFLSRTREYMADAFAAKACADPAPLQRALVRIAYGMAEVQRTGTADVRLIESTRALGIFDPKAASGVGNSVRTVEGNLAHDTTTTTKAFDAVAIEPIFLFDLFNPWAKVSELSSTHPLTGKRIRALNTQAKSLGHEPLFRFDKVDRAGKALDNTKLYGKFFFEVIIYFLPFMLPVPMLVLAFFIPGSVLGAIIAAAGMGMLIKGFYRYSVGSSFQRTTMYDLMCDPYASPLRGQAVELEGEIIGKAMAGSKVGEDLTMKDRSGGLVMLNYESLFWIFGNLFFGFGKAGRIIGQQATARGWFRRSVFQFVDLADLTTADGENISSYTRFWGIAGGAVVMAVGSVLALAGLLI
jgi:Zn-dependent protease with chaperone function